MKHLYIYLLLFNFKIASAQINSSGSHSETIPIYTLQEGNLAVPISFTYDASGVKVSSFASSVGQNWSLSAGGKISRIVRDKPDEMYQTPNGNVVHGQLFKDYTGVTDHLVMRDTEKDIFVLQLNGKVISFVLDKLNPGPGIDCFEFESSAIPLNATEDIKIEFMQFVNECAQNPIPNNIVVRRWNDGVTNFIDQLLDTNNGGAIRYFRVTTPDGIQYYFGETVEAREYAFTYKAFEDQEGLCSATTRNETYFNSPTGWMLSRIVFPKGNSSIAGGPNLAESKFQEINFKYKRTQSLLRNIKSSVPFTIYSTDGIPIQSAETDHKKQPLLLNSEISKIESDNFVIDFNSDYIFSLADSLTNTALIDNFSSSNFTAKRRLDIGAISEHGTILPTTIECYNTGGGVSSTYTNPFKFETIIPKAEILQNMLVTDKISGKKLAYYFDHSYFQGYVYSTIGSKSTFANGRLKLNGIYQIKLGISNEIQPGYSFTYNSETLPDYVSFAQDHWGYYNGHDDNETKTGLIELPSAQLRTALGITVSSACADKVSSNLDVNETLAQAGILTKLKLPTGGEISYTYESNECDNYFSSKELVNGSISKVNVKKVGGLRIANISVFDPQTNSTYYKKYSYTKHNSTESSGIMTIVPTYVFKFLETMSRQGSGCVIPNHTSDLVDRFINGGHIYYHRIKEESYKKVGNDDKNEGYITYEYYSQNNASTAPYQIFDTNSNTWKEDDNTFVGLYYTRFRNSLDNPISDPRNGLLTKIKVYNSTNILINESVSQYSSPVLTKTINQGYFSAPYQIAYKPAIGQCTAVPLQETNVKSINNPIPAIIVNSTRQALMLGFNGTVSSFVSHFIKGIHIAVIITAINSIAGPYDCSDYLLYPNLINYNVPLYQIRQISETSTQYDITGANPIITTSEYFYDSGNRHNSPIRIKNTFSNSDDIIESFTKYNLEYDTFSTITDEEVLSLRKLRERNMVVPVENYKTINGRVIAGNYMQYYFTEGYEGLPSKIWSLELENPLASYTPSDVPSSSNPVVVKSSFYFPKISFTAYNTKGLLSSSKNIEQVGTNIVSAPENTTTYTHNDLIPVSTTSATGLPLSRTTTFETIPLYGITKVTSPNNDTLIKEYDELGRVKLIKDKDGNILKSYIYNSKN